MKSAYLGLGSNVGERERMLQQALTMLADNQLRIVCVSPVYETEPVGVREQGWFLNAVAEVELDLFPMQLLARTQRVEREMGRKRGKVHGPRAIDIDILLFGRFVIDTPQLVVPHPRMAERRFVLEPLADLEPELRHPITRRTVREMLGDVKEQVVRRTAIRLQRETAPQESV